MKKKYVCEKRKKKKGAAETYLGYCPHCVTIQWENCIVTWPLWAYSLAEGNSVTIQSLYRDRRTGAGLVEELCRNTPSVS